MSLSIRYLKSRPVGKVTFRLSAEAAPEAAAVHLVGDFNDWSCTTTPMKKLKDGSFKVIVELDRDLHYCFRYLIDGHEWANDWDAHRYEPHPYGDGDNSVVEV